MDLTIANILRTLDKELSKNTYQESPEAQELFWEAMDAETEKQAKKILI